MFFVLLIFLGLTTGLLGGLLGIGGGVITVPALYYLLSYYDFPSQYLMHTCIATSLASTILTSSGSTFAHARKKTHHVSAILFIIPGLIFGCILGAMSSHWFSSNTLRTIFGCMAILFALYFFFPKLPPLHIRHKPDISLSCFALLIGTLSSLLGVGGGLFLIPVLLGYRLHLNNAIATSSAGTLTTALTGSLAYFWINSDLVNLSAFLCIGLSSLCTTHLGCQLAHILPHTLIKRIFACALGLTGLVMIFH
jgi:uncharacterized membrane protein YfcA